MLSKSHNTFFEVNSLGTSEKREVQSWSFTWKREGEKKISAYFAFISITQAGVTHLEGQLWVISTAGTSQVTAPIRFGNLLPQESRTKHGCWNFSQVKQLPKRKTTLPCRPHQFVLLSKTPPSLFCWRGSLRRRPAPHHQGQTCPQEKEVPQRAPRTPRPRFALPHMSIQVQVAAWRLLLKKEEGLTNKEQRRCHHLSSEAEVVWEEWREKERKESIY